MVNPAPWIDVDTLANPNAFAGIDPPTVAAAIGLASRALYEFTGRRWPGAQTDQVHPVVDRVCGSYRWRHRPWSVVELPGYPVTSIDQVLVEGDTVDPEAYRVVDARWLVRTDGEAWPRPRDIVTQGPGDTTDDWRVTYIWGRVPPADAKAACLALAYQLGLAMMPRPAVQPRLPQRISTITRNGVSMAVLDPLTLFDDGRTGLPEVDMWIAAVNRPQAEAGVHVLGSRDRVRRWASS